MWTHHNPYDKDIRFHQTPPTNNDRKIAGKYFKEKQNRMQTLQITRTKREQKKQQ